MISNGQCLKSGDRKLRISGSVMDRILDCADNAPIMEASLSDNIENAKNIMIIADCVIDVPAWDKLADICGSKLKYIISGGIPEKYDKFKLVIDKNSGSGFKYFGANAGIAPILLHESIFECDLIIVLSGFKPDTFGNLRDALSSLYISLSHSKSLSEVIKNALSESLANDDKENFGFQIGDFLYKSIREAVITAGKYLKTFAVNISMADSGNMQIFCGDIFMSRMEALKYGAADDTEETYDGAELHISCGCISDFVSEIERACRKIVKGGRLAVIPENTAFFGNYYFKQAFQCNSLYDMAYSVNQENHIEIFYAFILKYCALNRHISMVCDEAIAKDVIQAGLNPIRKEDCADFLKNCRNIGIIDEFGTAK